MFDIVEDIAVLKMGGNADRTLTEHMAKQTGRDGGSVTLLRPDGTQYPGSPFTGGGLPGPWAATVDGNDNVWVSNFAAPNSPITQLCGTRTENCPPGMKTGDQISPPGGYVGGGLQMQTDLAVDPAGNVWVMNNWQDIASCFGSPNEALSTRCGGQGVTIFYGMAKPVARRKSVRLGSHNARAVLRSLERMSACGTTRTSGRRSTMSVDGGKADLAAARSGLEVATGAGSRIASKSASLRTAASSALARALR